MDPVLIATLGGLGALFSWGLSDWLISRASKTEESPALTNAVTQISGTIAIVLLMLLTRTPIPSLHQLPVLIIAGACFTLAYIFFIKALGVGQAGIVVPLANTYPIITIALSALFLGLQFDRAQITALIIIVIGAVLVGTEKINPKHLKHNLTKEVINAFIAALFWGIGFFALDNAVTELSWLSILGTVYIVMGILSLVYVYIYHKGKVPKNIWSYKSALLAGLAVTIGSAAFYSASVSSQSVVIPAVIASASPLATVLLAQLFDGEKMAIYNRIGTVLVVGGIIALNF